MELSRKIFLKLIPPTEEDARSTQKRVLDGLRESISLEESVFFDITVLRKLYPVCEQANWQITVSLAWSGNTWVIVDLEPGDTTAYHYGIALDLGSTTIVGRLVDCNTQKVMTEHSVYNGQIRFGTDILTRIFYAKDQPEHLEEIRQATLSSIQEVVAALENSFDLPQKSCIQMVIGGNTTMIHFLIGMDAFYVFSSPYAVQADDPGFILGRDMGIPVSGYVYCFPCKSNYLGGDIISGMIATKLYKEENISAFFDIGTNGELVIGNKEFLLCGAGAAGPALEGAVVRTGMRAGNGAVDRVKIVEDKFENHVIGDVPARGICGSGIVDLIAQLFLNGWIDIRGKYQPEKSPHIQEVESKIQKETDFPEGGTIRQYAVEYEPGLYFYQDDIDEFVLTKAAAYTMVEYMLKETGISPEKLEKFYVCGAFGKYVSKESAIAIGMYMDIERDHIINAGNSSLDGAQELLLHREYLEDIQEILDKMTYIQYGAVANFLEIMMAAQYLPHIDLERYPSVKQKLMEKGLY